MTGLTGCLAVLLTQLCLSAVCCLSHHKADTAGKGLWKASAVPVPGASSLQQHRLSGHRTVLSDLPSSIFPVSIISIKLSGFVHKFSAKTNHNGESTCSCFPQGGTLKHPACLKSRPGWPEEDRGSPADGCLLPSGLALVMRGVKALPLPGHKLPHALDSKERGWKLHLAAAGFVICLSVKLQLQSVCQLYGCTIPHLPAL